MNWKTTAQLVAIGVILSAGVVGVSYTLYNASSKTSATVQSAPSNEAIQSTCEHRTLSEQAGGVEKGKIVGGRLVENPYLHPWIVRLERQTQWFNQTVCGGSLIDDLHVLTAAHCLLTSTPDAAGFVTDASRLWAVIDRRPFANFTLAVRVASGFTHLGFNVDVAVRHHDIALLRLTRSLAGLRQWRTLVSPACLPASNETAPAKCRVAGWGQTDLSRAPASNAGLRSVQLDVYSFPDCIHFKPFNHNRSFLLLFDGGELCSSTGPQGGKSACGGDSGGPLVCRTGQGRAVKLFGVVSGAYGNNGCGRAGYAGSYTSVAYNRGWLRYVAQPALTDTARTSAWLQCLREACLRYQGDLWWERNEAYLCSLFASYVLCQQHHPRPASCSRLVPPALGNDPANRTARGIEDVDLNHLHRREETVKAFQMVLQTSSDIKHCKDDLLFL